MTEDITLKIRIAGNTEAPCYWAIKEKGYEVTLSCELIKDEPFDCIWTMNAVKGECLFSSDSMESLLGLIAMWEIRGDDWRGKRAEIDLYFDVIKEAAPFYDQDGHEIVE